MIPHAPIRQRASRNPDSRISGENIPKNPREIMLLKKASEKSLQTDFFILYEEHPKNPAKILFCKNHPK